MNGYTCSGSGRRRRGRANKRRMDHTMRAVEVVVEMLVCTALKLAMIIAVVLHIVLLRSSAEEAPPSLERLQSLALIQVK